ncbi:methyl-accepting chemotaxis protein [Leptospira idonii]|uniref:Methyl-accepting chemotaxis protein n=1 Tax=Leptospira idonii TaxID=1193500 RepID=A0A4R9M1A5_9LEPT|nr:methyl-accepting chemotaxis protein [Leptospira idonii]TGN19605.1 methyl-accepting chemotaxis protein [Leptospira idonii]
MSNDYKKAFRFRYIIDKEFQFKFLLHYSLLFISGVVVTLGFLYWLNKSKFDGGAVFRLRQDAQTVYWKVENDEATTEEEKFKFVPREIYLPNYDHQLNMYTIQFDAVVTLSVLYLALITIFSIFKSHKMAGPIYSIKRSLQRLASGDPIEKIRIRKDDEFQELVEVLNEVIQKRMALVGKEANDKK